MIVDAVYEGAAGSKLSGEAISKVLPGTGNMGGFRAYGPRGREYFVALSTSGEDVDWPDRLDPNTGQFVYFGDNKKPGHELHDTPRGGNLILRRVYDLLHAATLDRGDIPPFFVFKKYPTPVSSHSVQFKGLAVPGLPGLPATADLVAVWKTTSGERFQNYQSLFTVLDVPLVKRAWLEDVAKGTSFTDVAPEAWLEWVRKGKYRPLTSESTTAIRDIAAQTPGSGPKSEILLAIYEHFKTAPTAFEAFAARPFQMHDQRVIVDEITRGSVDGGRDAVGRYTLGLSDDPVYAEFSLEAKCYRPGIFGQKPNTVGVKDVARLISRIRHREFGVLVTTSAIAKQAYEEVREDRHPIIFFSGKDIADLLTGNGYNTADLVKRLLQNEFPTPGAGI
ncbi:MAG: restriction endonuclease [Paracoccaceae bacterium]|nr:restriction endonuclease [Paracoccaceae bacterium]